MPYHFGDLELDPNLENYPYNYATIYPNLLFQKITMKAAILNPENPYSNPFVACKKTLFTDRNPYTIKNPKTQTRNPK